MCADHWAALRAAISERGLDPFVSKSGKEAAARMVAELTGGARRETFDPLMSAHNAIVSNAVEVVGLFILTVDGCPICYIAAEAPDGHPAKSDVKNWIRYAADGALEAAKRLAEDAPPAKGEGA